MKNTIRLVLSLALILVLVLSVSSCEMLPEGISGILGDLLSDECCHYDAEWITDVNPTCKLEGKEHLSCIDCGELLENRTIPVVEHKLGEWEIESEPTCAKPGVRYKKCSVCKSKALTEEIPTVDNHVYNYGTCINCSAKQTASVGLKYTSLGDGTCSVSGMGSCTDTSLVIPAASPSGERVVSIDASAFADKAIASVIIADSVTEAGIDAFKGCPIKNATVPAAILPAVKGSDLVNVTVTGSGKIPDYSLNGAIALRTVTMSEGITEIGQSAFASCSVLYLISMPDSLITIGDSAFSKCTTLVNVTIGKNVEKIGDFAFQGSRAIETINIPASVKYIGKRAINSPYLTSAVFEAPEGWYAASTAIAISGSSVDPADLSDPELAAGALKKTYSELWLKKN